MIGTNKTFDKKTARIINIINKLSDINLSPNNYDAILCKRLVSSNTLSNNRASHQTHIAITGESMNMFPALYIQDYQNTSDSRVKSFFYLKVPVNIYQKNVDYGKNKNTYSNDNLLSTNMSIKVSKRDDGDQIELANPSQSSDKFTDFRKILNVKDYIVFTKIKNQLKYEAFIIKSKDMKRYNMNTDKDIFQMKKSRAFSTPVYSDLYDRNDDINLNESGKNVIYYGAPGTGKSFSLNKNVQGIKHKRITFYPDYDYSDFVGGLRPVRVNGKIDYCYVGGILANTIVKAINNPSENIILIIEEINRANASSVFGDTFQLLDRNENNSSSMYSIDNIDLAKYIDKYTNKKLDYTNNGVKFPGNFSIMATMNPTDQNTFQLDTAFTRRWEMNYKPIIWDNASDINVSGFDISWPKLGKSINYLLAVNGVEEEKMLGQYFMSNNELKDSKLVASKLLGYLWNDVLKYRRRDIFNAYTLSELMKQFLDYKKKLNIFNDYSLGLLNEVINENK